MDKFLSTSPARGTTVRTQTSLPDREDFYPRPPRGGRRKGRCSAKRQGGISIHVPREGDDRRRFTFSRKAQPFLSTSPARGTTLCSTQNAAGRKISIHVPREGDDVDLFEVEIASSNFYPRPPRGGRPASPLPPAAGLFYFYPRPPRGGRQKIGRFEARPLHFYPRPPRGGRLHGVYGGRKRR